LFSNVKNTDQRSFKCPSQPLAAEHLQLLIKAIPIKEGDHLRILWPVTPNIQFYKEGPCRYLGRLIGHEGEGSIFHIIKELGWAMDLTAGAGSDSNEYSFFSVSMRLTDLGHEHMDDIIGLVFKYLRLLKQDGIHEWIFDELVSINETAFHYQDKVRPISYVKNTVSNMLLFPPEEWLVGASLPSKYAPHTINKILDELSPERVRYAYIVHMTILIVPAYICILSSYSNI
jgi:insulysin